MILFFECKSGNIIAVGTSSELPKNDIEKLTWLFGEAPLLQKNRSKVPLSDQGGR